MKNVGLNLRLIKSLQELIEQALRLEVPLFQSFVIFQETGKYINATKQVCEQFCLMKNDLDVYIHGSYKINLASKSHDESCHFLKKELELTQRLGSNYLILHPGSVYDNAYREQGIDAIAKKINCMLKTSNYPTIVLENSAFARRNIGGDLNDLAHIRSKIDKPEKVKFCIDTAHAYSFGYNLADEREQNKFIMLIDELLGLDSVALLHANDTKEHLGSYHDCHAVPGHGNIGFEALKRFITDTRLAHIPVIMELPPLDEHEIKKILQRFKE